MDQEKPRSAEKTHAAPRGFSDTQEGSGLSGFDYLTRVFAFFFAPVPFREVAGITFAPRERRPATRPPARNAATGFPAPLAASSTTACAAANRAIGTRKGEQET